jgi:tape measure domain-containing protein
VTEPIDSAYVELLPEAGKLGPLLKAELDKALSGLRDSVKVPPVKVPLQPDEEPLKRDLPKKTPPVKVPLQPDEEPLKRDLPKKTPPVEVPLDPLFSAFQSDLKRQVDALAKRIAVEVPVRADTDELRSDLARQLAVLQQRASVKIPVEAGDRRQLERELGGALQNVEQSVNNARDRFVVMGGEGQTQLRRVGAAAEDASRSITSHLGGALSALKLGSALAVGAVATGLEQITSFGLKGASALEQTTIGFKSLLGSEQAATAEIKQLQDFAAATPFQFEGVADAARRMLAFGSSVGITREQLIPTLTTVGDLVSVLGGTQESVDATVRAFGQMASKGKVQQDELLQLSEALPGFNVQQAIAAKLGVSVAQAQDMISSGAVDAKTGIQALLEGMAKFPGAAGAMAAQAQTLGGVFSTFKDTVQISLANAFAPVIPQIKDTLTQITPVIGQAFDTLGPALGGALAAILPTLAGLVQGLVPILAPIIEGLGQGLAAIGPSLAPLGAALGEVVRSVTPLLPLLGDIIGQVAAGLAPAITALAPIFAGLAQGLTFTIQPLLPLITQFGGILAQVIAPAAAALAPLLSDLGDELGVAIGQTLTEIGPQLPELAKALVDMAVAGAQLIVALEPLIPPMVQLLTQSQLLVPTLEALTFVFEISAMATHLIADAIAAVIDWFSHLGDTASSTSSAFTGAWNAVAGFFTDLWNQIVAAFSAGVAFVESIPGRVGAALAALPGLLASIAQQAFDTFTFNIGYGIGLVIKFFIDLPGRILGALAALGSLLVNVWNSASSAVMSAVTAGINAVVSFFTALPGRVWGAIISIPGLLSSLWNQAWAAATGAISAGINAASAFLQTMPGRAASALSAVAGAVRGALSGAADWLVDAGRNIIMGLIHGIESVVGAAVDAAKRAVGNVIAGAKSALGISSPSTVFAEIGGNTVAGYVKGVTAAAGDAQQAVIDMLNTPTNATVGVTAGTTAGAAAAATAPPAAAATPGGPPLLVQVFLGTREITDILDVRIEQALIGQARAVLAGPRTV